MVRPWAVRESTRIVQRLLGYWLMWQHVPGGRAEMIDRGWMSRAAAYKAEADFLHVFGVSVEQFDPTQMPTFLFGDPSDESLQSATKPA